MSLNWSEINKTLCEHWGFKPEEKTEERRQEMNADLFTKNKTDIALLRKCIEKKWIPIYEGKKTDEGGDNCPLCQKYPACMGCPIQDDTGERLCRSTPYTDDWRRITELHGTGDTPEKKLAALQEITYLEGLIARLTVTEKIEKEKKVYHPLVYYIALEEPTVDALSRVHLQRDLTTFLRKQGLKVRSVRYSFGTSTHLMFNPKSGEWSHEGDVSILIK